MKVHRVATVISITLIFSVFHCTPVTVDEQREAVIFGKYYGYCFDKGCVNMYKVHGDIAYKDTIENFPSWMYPYESESFKELPGELYNIAKTIYTIIPDKARNDTTTVYGEPDAGDWGGFCVEIINSGGKRYFLLDNMKENLDPDLRGFRDDLDALVNRLNELTRQK